MNKVELEEQVRSLETSLKTFEGLQKELANTKEKLESVNKPIITSSVLDEVRDAIYQCLTNFDFDNTDHYEYEFEIDYNNQLTLSNLSINSFDDLLEDIGCEIEACFNVVDEYAITDISN